jgi:S-adenosylmethionine hydrolase
MRPAGRSSTFHGRDVFAPVAAHLAQGEDWTKAGPPIDTPVRLEFRTAKVDGNVLRGHVVGIDGPYGNLITDVPAALFEDLGYGIGDRVTIEIGSERLRLPFARTFSDVKTGAALVYIDSRARLGIAINRGNFATAHRVSVPTPIIVRRK